MTKEAASKLLDRAYFYLRFRERTEKEMRIYLRRKAKKYHRTDDDIEKVIQTLKNQNFLDDRRFVELYVSTRSKLKPRGEYALKQELMQKGVSRHLITEYFSEHELDEDELAKRALEKVWNRYKDLEEKKRYKRSADYLRRRGFSFDAISRAYKDISATE